MNRSSENPVVIVGGGVSGLTLAYLLSGRGIPAVVIEKEPVVGGLARSFRYGDFTFDIGPHRFHSNLQPVVHFINDILGRDTRVIPRKSSVRFLGRSYPWPLDLKYILFGFPPRIAFSILRDAFRLYKKYTPKNFKDQIVDMYGRTLYRHFFEGYTSKFVGITPELTHIDWALTGIDRAIIDSRLKMHTLWQLILAALFHRNQSEFKFIYPVGGCGRFTDVLADRFRDAGGEIVCGSAVDEMAVEGGRISTLRAGGRVIHPSIVVWTGTVHSLAGLLGLPKPDLRYISLICYNLMLTAGEEFSYQWSYHGAADVIFSRLSVPNNFDPGMTPSGQRSLCVEVSATEEKAIYQRPMDFFDRVMNDLKREGQLMTDDEVADVRVERIPWAYPMYKLNYRQEMEKWRTALAPFKNLVCAGRLGLFWYNNMDHCIEAGLSLVEKIAHGVLEK